MPEFRKGGSWPSHARAQGAEKLVQLLERLAHRIRRPGAGSVESFLRGIELVHDQQGLATFFLEGHRGDRPTLTTFLVGPDEARVRCHFEVRAEERHSIGFELETVLAPTRTSISQERRNMPIDFGTHHCLN